MSDDGEEVIMASRWFWVSSMANLSYLKCSSIKN